MTVRVSCLSRSEALASTRLALRLPQQATFQQVIGQSLRRAAYILSPCPRYVLARSVTEALQHLAPEALDLRTAVAETLEDLTVYGDILEMRNLPVDEWEEEGALILRPSPPCFVQHHSGSVILVGVAGDEIVPLPSEASDQVRYHGSLRFIDPQGDQDLSLALKRSGLSELPSAVWLRMPAVEAAQAYLSKWSEQLRLSPRPVNIDGLTIFAGGGADFYAGRQVPPEKTHNGTFIARRSQRFGSDLWCLVELEAGTPVHLLDLVSDADRLRPSDIAWRILMAMDSSNGSPQEVRVRRCADRAFLDFFAPLPAWARRHLAADGEVAAPERCLLSYCLPRELINGAIAMLADRLWLREASNQSDGGTK